MQPTRMRRPRRHRWLTVSVFFIAYSVFQAVMTSSTASEPASDTNPEPSEKKTTPIAENEPEKGAAKEEKPANEGTGENKEPAKEESKTEDKEEEKTEIKDKAENTDKTENGESSLEEEEEEEEDKKKMKDAGYKETEDTAKIRERERQENQRPAVPTLHPLRDNCTPPAIEQFPKPLMGQSARKHGGLIIHILVAVFTFIGLAIVCDEYFVSSLDRICEELKLAPDVAGATFMAAGSSAPELATVVIGVFCAQDDIGVSGVIGSAVFNIMFVISVCALCAGTVSHLNWWPLCRDCFFYAVSILVMLCTIANGYVSWPEALFMLIMYGVYCVALRFNTALEQWAMKLPLPFKLPTREEQAALVTYKSAGAQPPASAPGVEGQYTQMEGQTKETPMQDTPYRPDGAYDNAAYNADPTQTWDPNAMWDPNNAWSEQPAAAPPAAGWNAEGYAAPQQPPQSQPPAQSPSQAQQPQQPPQPVQPAYYKAKEYNPETAVDPLVKPIGANKLQLACWYVAFPIHWSCRHTMPDCRGRWYPITFIISMLWISFYSYFMVWMITIIGYTLGIPDTVMGLTFVAAGVSVPDALSSLAVIKEGYGDMAVSNAVGSNVFDILVCLGLPWFIQTAIIQPGSHVNVISKGLIYSTLSLFSTVIFLVVATHANGWKLDRKYGAVLMVWYLLFITLASLYELNIFGEFNKPDCISSY
ncbi:probable sodium/potassium/calcium exchanger CG1090 isoform X2 [Galleria mellonella]|uniref:Probable sodium/potassium/calcium exchanger CG1090 isoform X2 n=1 Tax=Galleria mellonella TaxID=7137 RepID=A0A6J1WIZ0_GALME|nr:probable sodium/potassium/calcium exchanger CG1090 isoform X2 [Galleria mellonella]